MKSIFKEKHVDFFVWTMYALTITYVLAFPSDSVKAALSGCELFYKSIFPGLFPFFILSSFAVNCRMDTVLGKAFGIVPKKLGVSSGEYTYVISILSGYPTSTKTVCEGYSQKRISKRDAAILLILSSNCSAAFIISFIGGRLLENNTAALILLFSNYLSPIIAAWLLAGQSPQNRPSTVTDDTAEKMSYISGFVSAVRESVSSVLSVGGFVVFFSVVVGMAEKISVGNEIINLLLSPVELSNGCNTASTANIPVSLKIGLMGFLIGFGGICVCFQNLSFIEKTDLDKALFVKYKFITGIISFVISYLLSTSFIIGDVSVFAPYMRDTNVSFTDVNLLLLALLIIIILYTLIERKTEKENEHK